MIRQLLLNLALLLTLALTSAAQTSVLDNGQWVKLAVVENSIYKITYQDMVDFGLEPNAINPSKIKVYGNGSGMLPQANDSSRIFDLREIAISVSTQAPGQFQQDDYILLWRRH